MKNKFVSFVRRDLGVPLVGITLPSDYSQSEVTGLSDLMASFSIITSVPEALKKISHPRELLAGARSIIMVAVPNYIERALDFEQCREKLLGTASALHVTAELLARLKEITGSINSFFTSRGFACRELSGTLFPAKIIASRCGIGFYGKNSMILHPDHGSWLSLIGFITDAILEPDEKLEGDCGTCTLCVTACPVKALHTPYHCDEMRCVNFHLGHNKRKIPLEVRAACRNIIGQSCTVCKDVCPKNKHLRPLPDYHPPKELLNPPLLDILHMDESEWKKTFGRTLLGLTMRDKKYLKRNAAIALGNFKDERAVPALEHLLRSGDDEVEEYAAWALEKICSPEVFNRVRD